MAKKVYEESKIQAIADAIREKSGSVALYNTSEMLYGVNEVYEAGRDAEHGLCWDAIQREGTRTEYGFAFYKWRGEWFYPKYDIVLGDKVVAYEQLGTSTFRNFNDGGDTNFDLTARLEECGVKLDTSKCPNLLYFMLGIRVKRIPTIDLSSATGTYMTLYATSLQIIDKLIFSESTNLDTTAFQYNGSLTTITEVEGVIAKNINLQHSPLDVPSINRIIACLKDYSSIGGTHTLTLKADRQNMLTDAEKAVATNKGWTLVWS